MPAESPPYLVITIKYVSRHYQMSPEYQNCPQLRSMPKYESKIEILLSVQFYILLLKLMLHVGNFPLSLKSLEMLIPVDCIPLYR